MWVRVGWGCGLARRVCVWGGWVGGGGGSDAAATCSSTSAAGCPWAAPGCPWAPTPLGSKHPFSCSPRCASPPPGAHTREHARLVLLQLGTLQITLPRRRLHVRLRFSALRPAQQRGQQRVLGRDDHVGRAVQRVGAGGEHRERRVGRRRRALAGADLWGRGGGVAAREVVVAVGAIGKGCRSGAAAPALGQGTWRASSCRAAKRQGRCCAPRPPASLPPTLWLPAAAARRSPAKPNPHTPLPPSQ